MSLTERLVWTAFAESGARMPRAPATTPGVEPKATIIKPPPAFPFRPTNVRSY